MLTVTISQGNTHLCSDYLSCSNCTIVCPTTALRTIEGEGVFLEESFCIQCGKCINVCPTNTISQTRKGTIIKSTY